MRALILAIAAVIVLAGCYTEELSRTESTSPLTRPPGFRNTSAQGARPRMSQPEPEESPWYEFQWLWGQDEPEPAPPDRTLEVPRPFPEMVPAE